MAARADALCDLAKAAVEAAASANPITGTTVTVTCDDDPDIDADAMTPGQMVVMIWWEGYSDAGPTSRSEDATDYRLCVLVVEKCDETGRVPTDWRRARSEWVDGCVIRALADARDQLDGAYALSLDDVTFDQEEMVERWLFWTRVMVTLRDEREV